MIALLYTHAELVGRENEMKMQIKSRKLNRTLTFSVPGSSYIFVDLNGKPGTLGYQICAGGGCNGETLSYSGSDPDKFASICRRWYRAHI